MMRETPKDRISNLPESLLHHIHSFLNIRDAARTSVLSKRWKYIWITVPILDLDTRYCTRTSQKFMDFVDGTLHRHSSNLDKFLLPLAHNLDAYRVHSWISNVIRGNIKELHLFFCQQDPLFIPLSLFTCESLISLQLRTIPTIHLPKYISLPRLKRLELHYFNFSDESWNEELFSNSFVLEELILEDCNFRMRNFCISIPSLKLLKFHTMDPPCRDGLKDCALKIDAPSLVSFNYFADVAKEYVLSSFPKLMEAFVCIHSTADGAEISRLLNALAHVKCLTVNDQTLQVIYMSDLHKNLLTFHNVKMLSISDLLHTDQGLIALLNAVPNLEALVFDEFIYDEEEDCDKDDAGNNVDDNKEHSDADSLESKTNHDNGDQVDIPDAAECNSNDNGEGNHDTQDESWALDNVTTGCLFVHLKSVCCQEFVGNPRELKWVKLILGNAKALQNMTVRYYDSGLRFVNGKSEKELVAVIPCFPRASAGCVVKFYSWNMKSVIVL